MSQEQLAHDAGVDRAYLSRVERAVTYVGLEIIEKLATILESRSGRVLPATFSGRSPTEGRLGSAAVRLIETGDPHVLCRVSLRLPSNGLEAVDGP